MTTILVGVYWGARTEPFENAVARVHGHFGALASVSEHLARWYLRGSRKPNTPIPVDTGPEGDLAGLLAQGVNRRDTDNAIINELGWRLSLWNGSLGSIEASTSILCNCTSPFVSNSALVELRAGEIEPISAHRADALLKRLIDVWEPDEGVVNRSVWLPAEQRREDTNLTEWKA